MGIQILLELVVPEWKCQEMIRELNRDQVKEHFTGQKTVLGLLKISKARELGLEHIQDRELSLKVIEQKK